MTFSFCRMIRSGGSRLAQDLLKSRGTAQQHDIYLSLLEYFTHSVNRPSALLRYVTIMALSIVYIKCVVLLFLSPHTNTFWFMFLDGSRMLLSCFLFAEETPWTEGRESVIATTPVWHNPSKYRGIMAPVKSRKRSWEQTQIECHEMVGLRVSWEYWLNSSICMLIINFTFYLNNIL